MSRKIPLTPGQAVSIHGWIRARTSLTWGDVLANDRLNFGVLLGFNLSAQTLFTMQPELSAWVKAKKCCLNDVPLMDPWDPHPIRDLHADLADIARVRWDPHTLAKLLTYDELVEIGLTYATMPIIGLTLAGWTMLGFARHHAEAIPPHALYVLFGMAKQDILVALK